MFDDTAGDDVDCGCAIDEKRDFRARGIVLKRFPLEALEWLESKLPMYESCDRFSNYAGVIKVDKTLDDGRA